MDSPPSTPSAPTSSSTSFSAPSSTTSEPTLENFDSKCTGMVKGTCSTDCDGEILTFRYVWPLRIAKRLISNGERAVLHVSSPFCTAYNGCQFTWLLRMCDSRVLEMTNFDNPQPSSSRVNVTLYYKDGPTPDVTLDSSSICVTDATGRRILNDTPLEGSEYTLGSGWSPEVASPSTDAQWASFSEYVHANVGAQISVCVDLRIKASWFQPLQYLPSLESANSKLENVCEGVLRDIYTHNLAVPDADFFDMPAEKYAYHRHVFHFACQEIERRLDETLRAQFSASKIQTVFAHIYFNHVIMAETACFEDFVEILEAAASVHFPALKREVERFMCREAIVESADLGFIKKMLLLSERFQLPVLKMVSAGALVDKLISSNSTPTETRTNMREELLQIAEQITTTDDDDSSGDENAETLVHSVVDQLESLAKHIRRVSLSASCGNLPFSIPENEIATNHRSGQASPDGRQGPPNGFFAAPLPTKSLTQLRNAGQLPPTQSGRRSSLKTSRELLSFGSVDSDTSSLTNSPQLSQHSATTNNNVPAAPEKDRRRSVMFVLKTFPFTNEEMDDDVITKSDDDNDFFDP
uniref:BTB domain-containing protein n=1 Tax=Panagrellus redivivus TaxID=6233 RepID=A0A7E4ZZR7_PANRE